MMAKDINLILPSDKDLGAVYISDVKTAQSLTILKEYRIGAIVSVFRGNRLSHKVQDISRYLYLPAQDKQSFNISQYFSNSTAFIEESRKHTNVLVHCIAGISRSATIVAAYIIIKYGHSAEAAITLIQKRRKKISPNKGFRMQLQNISAGVAGKRRQEDEQTSSSRNKMQMMRSMSLQRQNLVETVQKNHKQKYMAKVEMVVSLSMIIKRHKKPSDQSPNKQKIVSKIEKVKANIINNLAASTHYQKLHHQATVNEPLTMATLLQSKIYQNKLRARH